MERDAGSPEAAASTSTASGTSTSTSTSPADQQPGDEGLSTQHPTASLISPALDIEMRAYTNVRYHEDRQAFFEASGRWANFLVVILGSSAAASALSQAPRLTATSAALSAIIGAAQLVFDYGGKARTHLELRKAYIRIMAKANKSAVDVAALRVDLLRTFEGEPEIFYAVSALAYNASQSAYGRPESTLLIVSPWQRRLRHVFRYDPSYFTDAIAAEAMLPHPEAAPRTAA